MIQVNRKNPNILVYYAVFLFKIKKYDEAQLKYKEAISMKDDNIFALRKYARFLNSRDRLTEA